MDVTITIPADVAERLASYLSDHYGRTLEETGTAFIAVYLQRHLRAMLEQAELADEMATARSLATARAAQAWPEKSVGESSPAKVDRS